MTNVDPNQFGAYLIAMVTEFRTVMGQKPNTTLAVKNIAEETDELLDAARTLKFEMTVEAMSAFLKETGDYLYVVGGLISIIEAATSAELQEAYVAYPQLPEKVDLIEKILMDSYEIFLNDDICIEVLNRIHVSNLSKLDDEGKPIFDEYGKVMKGPNYKAPDLTDLAVPALDMLVKWIAADNITVAAMAENAAA